jgi:circadian clock protein KaiC
VADWVILLVHRVTEQICTRRLRIVKYRGSLHGTNKYRFLNGEDSIEMIPITSTGLDHKVSTERVSSGVPRLDQMLGGQGDFVGSSILNSGAPGSGKTSLAAVFAQSLWRSGGRCLYLAFEESPSLILRNMRSIGFRLDRFVKSGLLQFHSGRPTNQRLELRLALIGTLVRTFQPAAVIVDPISSLLAAGEPTDLLKSDTITAIFTSLTPVREGAEACQVGILSLMDSWLQVRNLESAGERNRCLYVLQSRGMGHSHQVRESVLSSRGIQLLDVYAGRGRVLTGTARLAQQERELTEETLHQQEIISKRERLERKRAETAAQIASLRATLESASCQFDRLNGTGSARLAGLTNVECRLHVLFPH